ncbi:hypothetical protein SRL2020226_60480 [Mycobacterium kiyosense]|nr:hypothetical protein SRL2020226_60480 [Mycobacterium kiyosense]
MGQVGHSDDADLQIDGDQQHPRTRPTRADRVIRVMPTEKTGMAVKIGRRTSSKSPCTNVVSRSLRFRMRQDSHVAAGAQGPPISAPGQHHCGLNPWRVQWRFGGGHSKQLQQG